MLSDPQAYIESLITVQFGIIEQLQIDLQSAIASASPTSAINDLSQALAAATLAYKNLK